MPRKRQTSLTKDKVANLAWNQVWQEYEQSVKIVAECFRITIEDARLALSRLATAGFIVASAKE